MKKIGILIAVAGIVGLMGGLNVSAASRKVNEIISKEDKLSVLNEMKEAINFLHNNDSPLELEKKLDIISEKFDCDIYLAKAYMLSEYLSEEQCKSLLFERFCGCDVPVLFDFYKPYFFKEYYLTNWVNKNIKPDSKNLNSIAVYSIIMGISQEEMKEKFIEKGY